MKKLNTYLYVILFACLLTVPTAVSINYTATVAQAAVISISSKSTTLEVGKTKTLAISGTKRKASWTSSKKAVATISSSGVITAKAAGAATITAYVDGKRLTCKVTVVVPIKLDNTSLTIEKGKTATLKVTGTTKKINWTSSNIKVITVSSKGMVATVATGSAIVTAQVDNKKLTCNVTVVEPIAISNPSLNLEVGQTAELRMSGINYRATWTSSKKSVALVSYNGAITAVGEGTSTITAFVDGKKYYCKVTVAAPATAYEKVIIVNAGEQTASIDIPGDSDNAFTWTSNDTTIADASNLGTAYGHKAGTTTFTATNGELTYTYLVIVIDSSQPYLKNGAYSAKEMAFDKLHFVIPKSWSAETDTSPSDGFYLVYNTNSGSNFVIMISKTGKDAPSYNTAKAGYLKTNTESSLRNAFKSLYDDYGLSFKISNFKQSDYLADFGKVFKSEYTLTVEGDSVKQTIYDFNLGGYQVEMSATDAGDKDFKKITEYLLDSFVVIN